MVSVYNSSNTTIAHFSYLLTQECKLQLCLWRKHHWNSLEWLEGCLMRDCIFCLNKWVIKLQVAETGRRKSSDGPLLVETPRPVPVLPRDRRFANVGDCACLVFMGAFMNVASARATGSYFACYGVSLGTSVQKRVPCLCLPKHAWGRTLGVS